MTERGSDLAYSINAAGLAHGAGKIVEGSGTIDAVAITGPVALAIRRRGV